MRCCGSSSGKMSDVITRQTNPELDVPAGYEIWPNKVGSFDLACPGGDIVMGCKSIERAAEVARARERSEVFDPIPKEANLVSLHERVTMLENIVGIMAMGTASAESCGVAARIARGEKVKLQLEIDTGPGNWTVKVFEE